jgi:hypothetical protein
MGCRQEDTPVNMFSTTKGVSALAIAVAAARGLLSYDAKVAEYWPEFAQGSKGAITVRQLLAHQAGLPVIDAALTLRDLADPTRLSAILAAQTPKWVPGSRHGYHGVTLGWYESELLRHADPSGRSLGQVFAKEGSSTVPSRVLAISDTLLSFPDTGGVTLLWATERYRFAHLSRTATFGIGVGGAGFGVLTASTPFRVSAGRLASFRVVKFSVSGGRTAFAAGSISGSCTREIQVSRET